MDERAFGELSKRVAAAESRRGMLGAVAAGLTGVFGVAIVRDEAAATFGYCRAGGFACGKNEQCCTNKCLATGVCKCARKGKPCLNRVGVNCCSRKCKKGKCA